MSRTILIVDDERNIVDILEYNLKKEGYSTVTAYDGETGFELAGKINPDLILLDVMLPLKNGFEVCRDIRKTNNSTPIIMLTAREEETDKVFGLELGADDYITKPFSIREVLARVKTNIRRIAALPHDEEEKENIIRQGAIEMDLSRYSVLKNGKAVDLTQREFDLLKYLAQEPGKIYSREELMHDVWQYEFMGDLRAVDVTVRRLREKIEDNPANPEFIGTKRGKGYYFIEQ